MKSTLAAIAIAIANTGAHAYEKVDRQDRIAEIQDINYGMYRSYRDEFYRAQQDYEKDVWPANAVSTIKFSCDRVIHWGVQARETADKLHRSVRAKVMKEDINKTIRECTRAVEHINNHKGGNK